MRRQPHSDAGTTFSDIASVNLSTHQLAGSFNGSATDIGDANGIGIVVGANYLYAAFTTSSNTIATFAIQPGCQLSFLEDVTAAGLNGGSIAGMALHGNLLVVAYGDGSIESFSVATGLPVSNGDAQNSTGYNTSLNIFFPEGVDITQDGHWAMLWRLLDRNQCRGLGYFLRPPDSDQALHRRCAGPLGWSRSQFRFDPPEPRPDHAVSRQQ